ncbi:GNAT family N-acetyltransferase, partial [Bacillus subtilis]|nr:GNAT family N-acetyltransferase [Bacillus subtilis]
RAGEFRAVIEQLDAARAFERAIHAGFALQLRGERMPALGRFARPARIPHAAAAFALHPHEPEIAALPGKYAAPRGRLLLAWRGERVVGCAAFREIDPATCEMKRVYVRPEARGLNVGRQLVERLLHDAKAAGYARMCVDVLPEFVAARQLYASLGFTPAPPVAFNPVPG